MSWSVGIIGHPDKVAAELEAHSATLGGVSLAEYNDAKPHLVALVKQNANNVKGGAPPVVSLTASGSGGMDSSGITNRSIRVVLDAQWQKLAVCVLVSCMLLIGAGCQNPVNPVSAGTGALATTQPASPAAPTPLVTSANVTALKQQLLVANGIVTDLGTTGFLNAAEVTAFNQAYSAANGALTQYQTDLANGDQPGADLALAAFNGYLQQLGAKTTTAKRRKAAGVKAPATQPAAIVSPVPK